MNHCEAIISVENVSTAYKDVEVLKNISISVKVNQRWAIIGKNGTGKSTLIKTIASIIEPVNGRILIKGKDISKYKSRSRAQLIAYVPQKPQGIIPYTVYDFIMMGRFSSLGLLAIPNSYDHKIVIEAGVLCNVEHLMDRMVFTLSGGELQRVLLAGAVAQQTPILLLDEPTTYLDPAHERLFFNALSRVHEKQDLTIIMVTHDINTALCYCTHICGLMGGKIAFCGTTDEFRTSCPSILNNLYGVPFTRYSSIEDNCTVYGAWGKNVIT